MSWRTWRVWLNLSWLEFDGLDLFVLLGSRVLVKCRWIRLTAEARSRLWIPRFRCETCIGTISPPMLFSLTSWKETLSKWVFASVCVNANELCPSDVLLSVRTQWRSQLVVRYHQGRVSNPGPGTGKLYYSSTFIIYKSLLLPLGGNWWTLLFSASGSCTNKNVTMESPVISCRMWGRRKKDCVVC